jgi:hypothetical protein
VPKVFDAYQSACVLWASTSDMTDVAVFQEAAGLCTRVGNVANATVEATTAPLVSGATSTSAIPVATVTLPAASASSSAASKGGAAGPVVVGQVRHELRRSRENLLTKPLLGVTLFLVSYNLLDIPALRKLIVTDPASCSWRELGGTLNDDHS